MRCPTAVAATEFCGGAICENILSLAFMSKILKCIHSFDVYSPWAIKNDKTVCINEKFFCN